MTAPGDGAGRTIDDEPIQRGAGACGSGRPRRAAGGVPGGRQSGGRRDRGPRPGGRAFGPRGAVSAARGGDRCVARADPVRRRPGAGQRDRGAARRAREAGSRPAGGAGRLQPRGADGRGDGGGQGQAQRDGRRGTPARAGPIGVREGRGDLRPALLRGGCEPHAAGCDGDRRPLTSGAGPRGVPARRARRQGNLLAAARGGPA